MINTVKFLCVYVFFSAYAMAMNNQDLPKSQTQLDQIVLEEFKGVIQDYWQRLNMAQEANSEDLLKLLESGFWYAGDYFSLLEKTDNNKAKELLITMQNLDSFHHGFSAPNSGLNRTAPYEYNLAQKFKASEVIKHFAENAIILIDCSIAYQIAYYRALLRLMGDKDFDLFVEKHTEYPLFSAKHNTILQHTRLIGIKRLDGLDEVLPIGAQYYIPNNLFYTFKDPSGNAQGFNLLVSGHDKNSKPLFIGLGLNPDGMTSDSIKDFLIVEFNKTPIKDKFSTQSAWECFKHENIDGAIMNFLADKTIAEIEDNQLFNDVYQHLIKSYSKFDSSERLNLIVNKFNNGVENMILPYLNIKECMKFFSQHSDTKNTCNHCGKNPEKLSICGRCKKVYYCNVNCQKLDWKNHKLNCSKN